MDDTEVTLTSDTALIRDDTVSSIYQHLPSCCHAEIAKLNILVEACKMAN